MSLAEASFWLPVLWWWHLDCADGAERKKGDADEDVLVRQYRYLLTAAPLDVSGGVHAEVLAGMSQTDRGELLRAVAADPLYGSARLRP